MTDVMTFPDTVDEFMEQYKLVDEDHVYSNGTAFVPIFRMRQWFDHLQALPITNADRIRSMKDEELARFFDNLETKNYFGEYLGELGWLEWLKEESEDE